MALIPSLIFITGGVRSGKSRFAEKMAIELAHKTGGRLTFLATGVPSDPEMKDRITKHKLDRESSNASWRTLEKTVQIGEMAEVIDHQDIVLMDCVTTLLNNELFQTNQEWTENFLTNVKDQIVSGILTIKKRARTVIVVSNEVLHEPFSENKLVLAYVRVLGAIHQMFVRASDQAFLVEAGIPIMMKGDQS